MIDLHNHILPGVDDGARDLEESVEIARQVVSEGVARLAATPHLDPERNTGLPASGVRIKVAELQAALDEAGIDLTVVPGNELYLTPDAPELVESGVASPLGGGAALLVEVSLVVEQRPAHLDETLFRLQLAGYQPVLAHPERYPFVRRDVESLGRLVRRGVALQLTAPSLLGEYGPEVRETAVSVLQRGWDAVAASDRHHPGPGRSLAELHGSLAQSTSAELADLLLRTNPDRLLTGRPIVPPPRPTVNRAALFARLFRR